jgi:hypothetical protein
VKRVSPEEIEGRFASAGWQLDGGFEDYLVIGCSDEEGLSILTYYEGEARGTDDDPLFELVDHKGDLTYAVREVPTPEEAREMLREHGQPPAEEGG